MKKIINRPDDIMIDLLNGYELAHSDLIKVVENLFVVRTNPKTQGKVGIVVANGSGHEPCMVELVGEGLVDVNVAGNIFSAPSGDDICRGIKMADRGAGVIVLVSSHAGDIMNARMGVMMAQEIGINVEMVILWDDIFSAPKETQDERRGTCGLFFCWKTVGAAAEKGYSLPECIKVAEKTRENLRSLTVAIEAGTHPITGKKMFELPEDEIEVGMGVHGEAGTGRMKICSAEKLVSYMLDHIVSDKPFNSGDEVCVLLNNCGALTFMEMYIIYGEIYKYLEGKNIKIMNKWIGAYATTQEMSGFGISLLKVDNELLNLYNYPVNTIMKF